MVDATQKLIEMTDAETLIVPRRAAAPRADLEAQLEMLETVRERIEAIALEGRGVEDMIAEGITRSSTSDMGAIRDCSSRTPMKACGGGCVGQSHRA